MLDHTCTTIIPTQTHPMSMILHGTLLPTATLLNCTHPKIIPVLVSAPTIAMMLHNTFRPTAMLGTCTATIPLDLVVPTTLAPTMSMNKKTMILTTAMVKATLAMPIEPLL
jgi:hypothetical protein